MMADSRKKELTLNPELTMTEEEKAAGYHYCLDWDGLVIGPEDPEMECCTCKQDQ